MIVGWCKGSKCYYPITNNDGVLSCPCTGWLFNKKCYHMRDYLAGKFYMAFKYRIVGVDDYGVVTEIEGVQRFNPANLSTEEIADNISRTEDFLTRLMGMKVMLEEVVEKA